MSIINALSLINTKVQPFKAQAFKQGKFIEVSEKDLAGKWSVLIFMPAAFTFNCPTEVEDAADNYAEFQKAGAEVYIVTTDTHFSHKVWHETSPAVGKAKFPLVGDPTHQLTRGFGVHIEEEGLALRGTFIINPDGVIKTMEVHDNAIARDVKETLRKLKAAQYVAKNPGQVCPAKWNEGLRWISSGRSNPPRAAPAARHPPQGGNTCGPAKPVPRCSGKGHRFPPSLSRSYRRPMGLVLRLMHQRHWFSAPIFRFEGVHHA
jgi:NADH-dependent peroxiredoxin subunit C